MLSGTSSYVTVAHPLPTDNNVVALCRVNPALSASDIVRHVSDAHLAGMNALCLIISQNDLAQTPSLLDEYLRANLNGLAFCICIEKATKKPGADLIDRLTALSQDARYLKRNGRAVIVVEPVEISNDLTAWQAGEAFYLILSVKSTPLSQQPTAVDSVLVRNSLESIRNTAQYITVIESSIKENLKSSESCLYGAACTNSYAAADLRYARLFGIWIYYLRILARERASISLIFIERWNEANTAHGVDRSINRSPLSLITESARSGWASPVHATDLTLSLTERISADLLYAAQERAALTSAPCQTSWTWTRLKHRCRTWLRSYEQLHRPLRTVRNALLWRTGDDS